MKCLRCEEKAKPGCRGLCSQHYEQFRYARDKAAEKSREAATALDEAAVAAGLVLESKQGKRPDKAEENPFDSLLKKVLKKA